ncbi:uncharacterized protein LOC123316848 [Coccinella septempunctata]|uniref:uncharacterized protein LOC123316848 n=1 Tax=Coccinella septempunctata TaxID=41139 RepID=UPI001D0658DB|nr:uncharacterized protein LOC123316848 [Coccinella septempunctata]
MSKGIARVFRNKFGCPKEVLRQQPRIGKALKLEAEEQPKRRKCKNVQKEIRLIKNAWWTKAKQIQAFADQNDQRNFFNAVKESYGISRRKVCAIKDANGLLLTEDSDIRARCHFPKHGKHDLTKAFDSVNREALWSIMERLGVPRKFVNVCRSFHQNNMASVLYNGKTTDAFQTYTGIRQGCVLAPLLFNIFLVSPSMIVDSKLLSRGLEIQYRFEGGLFNLKRLRARTRTKVLTDLQYADDCGLTSDCADSLQKVLETFDWAYNALGLKINIAKTKIMCTPQNAERISIEDEDLEYFNYLGSVVSNKATIDDEIRYRVGSASRAFWGLRERVFDNLDLSIRTKAAVYRAVVVKDITHNRCVISLVVVPTMTYACATYRRYLKTLNQLQQRHLRQIAHIKWFHKISNKAVLERINSQSIDVLVGRAQLRWAGHVQRMPEKRLPKCVLYGELVCGQRSVGGQLKIYKDSLHEKLKLLNVQNDCEALAEDRSQWRRVVNSYRAELDRRRNPSAQGNFECPECGRVITSRIGLFIYRRTHRR